MDGERAIFMQAHEDGPLAKTCAKSFYASISLMRFTISMAPRAQS